MNVNVEAFTFVEKLIEKKADKVRGVKMQSPKLKGIGEAINLGKVNDLGVEEFNESTNSPKSKFKSINNKLIGLSESNYFEFNDFILKIYEKESFSRDCDFRTLLNSAFDWLLEVFEFQQARTELLSFLRDKIDLLTKEYHFYFQVKALVIEENIIVGNTEFMFFDEDEIINLYETAKESGSNSSIQEFKEDYGTYFNSINVLVKVKGVLGRANEIAFREAEMAVNLLKIYCCSHSVEELVQIFDIDYRFVQGSSAQYLQLPNGKINESTIHLKNFSGIVPVELTSDFLKRAYANGLSTFSQFIQNKKDNELYSITIDLIKQLFVIVSTYNNYEKTVKSISLLEGLCVPKDSGKAKGESILKKKFIPKIFSNKDGEIFGNLLHVHYNIRDKYLHNFVQIPINKKELSLFLEYQRVFILKIISLNAEFSLLSESLAYFDKV